MKRSRVPTAPYQDLLRRYPDTPLADIPWNELHTSLQTMCWQIIHDWRSESGMSLDMTLAEMLACKDELERTRISKRYRLVAFIRVDSEDQEPMTFDEVLTEQEQQRFLFPENIYRIEEVEPETSADRKEKGLCIPPESRKN